MEQPDKQSGDDLDLAEQVLHGFRRSPSKDNNKPIGRCIRDTASEVDRSPVDNHFCHVRYKQRETDQQPSSDPVGTDRGWIS